MCYRSPSVLKLIYWLVRCSRKMTDETVLTRHGDLDDRVDHRLDTERAMAALHAVERRRGAAVAGQPSGADLLVGRRPVPRLGRRLRPHRQLLADEFDPVRPEACGFFGGYFYINLSNVRMQGVRSPVVTVEQLDLAFFGDHPDVPPYEPHPADDRPDLVPKILEHLGWVMSTTSWPEIDEEKAARPSPCGATVPTWHRSPMPIWWPMRAPRSRCCGSCSRATPFVVQFWHRARGAVRRRSGHRRSLRADEAGRRNRRGRLGRAQLCDVGTVAARSSLGVAERGVRRRHRGPARRLTARRRARGRRTSPALPGARSIEFLVDFGSRGPNEWEMSAETWETRPEIALAAIAAVRRQSDDESPRTSATPPELPTESASPPKSARRSPRWVTSWPASSRQGLAASSQLGFRERTKTNVIRVVHEGRMAFRELGRRHAAAGHLADPAHVFMLVDPELDSFVADPASFRQLLADRHAAWLDLADLEPPYFIRDGNVPPLAEYPRRGTARQRWPSRAMSSRVCLAAPARTWVGQRVITDAADPGDLAAGRRDGRPADRSGLDSAVHGRRCRGCQRRRADQPLDHRVPRTRIALRGLGHRCHRADPQRRHGRGERRYRHRHGSEVAAT